MGIPKIVESIFALPFGEPIFFMPFMGGDVSPFVDELLLEDGFRLLQEDGFSIGLE